MYIFIHTPYNRIFLFPSINTNKRNWALLGRTANSNGSFDINSVTRNDKSISSRVKVIIRSSDLLDRQKVAEFKHEYFTRCRSYTYIFHKTKMRKRIVKYISGIGNVLLDPLPFIFGRIRDIRSDRNSREYSICWLKKKKKKFNFLFNCAITLSNFCLYDRSIVKQ